MIKFILLGIYVFGCIIQIYDIYTKIDLYKKYKGFVRPVIVGMIYTLIWPVLWLKNFINYYLDLPRTYKKYKN